MTIKEKLYTAENLLHLPDDGRRRELVGGEMRETAPAGNEHRYLAFRIASRLERHVDTNDLGRTYTAETGFKIASDPDTVHTPDAAFVSRECLEEAGPVEGFWPGAPDLVVEVVSPGDTHAEVVEKSLAWLDAGCRMVLVAGPERKVVTVYRSRENIRIFTAKEAVDDAEVVPGWRLPVAEIFA